MREYLNKIVYNTNEGVFKAIVVKLYQVSHKCPHFYSHPPPPQTAKVFYLGPDILSILLEV